ncbi:putative membrane protein [Ralstonia insidiosa]|uniref:Membrane protein n=1 Tax=Ralstonia insidiosa TaxID=190721 RepID=A0AAC9BFY4_9RALS|nr:putative membrane protein [Ralstonia insidiosa]
MVSPRPSASLGNALAVMAALVPGRSCGAGFLASIVRV